MKYVVWASVLLLALLHQDLWNWDDPRLVFGFLPLTLAYHASLSVVASIVWFLATRYAWPKNLDEDSVVERSPESGKTAS